MAKYSQVVDNSWEDRTLFAASIPHLFHFDLLYLWILEKPEHQRPKTWREEVEGWRMLVSLFLTGGLQVEEQPIPKPFRDFTEAYGVTTVSWLRPRLPQFQERIGVLSPTVLVRPLPDWNEAALKLWEQKLGDPRQQRPDELRLFVQLAARELRKGAPGSPPSYRFRLADILEREFGGAVVGNPPAGRHIPVSILRSLGWAQPRLATAGPETVPILVRDTEPGGQVRVRPIPRCKACNTLLTRSAQAEPIVVDSARFVVPCSNPQCPRPENQLALADFLIWYRSSRQIVAWRSEPWAVLENGWPPDRKIRGIEIQLEWNVVYAEGDAERRFLRLSFPDAEIREHRVEEVFFRKILVPGSFESFKGLPVRPEWVDALENRSEVLTELEPQSTIVNYRNLRLGGWPAGGDRKYGSLVVEHKEDLGVGIYPDPAAMTAAWKWYRLFLEGEQRREFRITAAAGIKVLPWVQELSAGLTTSFSVVSAANPDLGVTYLQDWGRPAASQRQEVERQEADAHIGVDFGTTNTVLCFRPLQREEVAAETEALRPSDLWKLVHWSAQPVRGEQVSPGEFLPPSNYRAGMKDRFLIPSALWVLNGSGRGYSFVRWNDREPGEGAEALSGFKWDPPDTNHQEDRRSFLREVLLLCLPLILKALSGGRTITRVNFGFAFPLAFDVTPRERMEQLLETLGGDLAKLTGLKSEFFHIDESWACVTAFGTFRRGDTFLVADMGGGTMDVALFDIQGENEIAMYQIGSLRFAGERCVRALAFKKRGKRGADDAGERRQIWELRDMIAKGLGRNKYGSDKEVGDVLSRFFVFALEFLRTMIAAHRHEHGPKRIHAVLVGNGWHLSDAFNDRAEKVGIHRFFVEYFNSLLRQLGDPDLVLYEGEPLSKLPSSKHLVVRGALENAQPPLQRRELGEELRLSKLPAGRRIRFANSVDLPWSSLLGEDVDLGVPSQDLEASDMHFDLQDMPPLSTHWRNTLLSAFRISDERQIPYPDEPQLRKQIGRSIKKDVARIDKGPLQVILESHWANKLED